MKTRIEINDHSASHAGYRSPGFQVIGRYGHGIGDELLGCKRFHDQADRLARSCARRSHFQEIVIQ